LDAQPPFPVAAINLLILDLSSLLFAADYNS
jgi:hypothetical protein